MERESVLQETPEPLSLEARELVLTHLLAGTSTAYLADWLTRAGCPTTPSALDDFRRSEYQRMGMTLDESQRS